VVKAANTIVNQSREIDDTVRQAVAARTNNAEAYRNATKRLEDIQRNYRKNKGGLFNAGTLYDEKGAKSGDIKTGVKDIALPTAVSMLDVYTLGKGNVISEGIKKGSLRTAIRSQAPNIGKAALGNYASGDLNVRAEGGTNSEAIKSGLLSSIFGIAPDVMLPLVGKSLRGVIPKFIRGGRLGEEVINTAPAPRPPLEPIDIPVREEIPLAQPVTVRNLNQPKPLIQEVVGDAPVATPDPLIRRFAEESRESAAREANFQARPDRRVDGVRPRAPQAPFKLDEGQVLRTQDDAIDAYASMLREVGEGNGTQLIPDGQGGYYRTSNNVRTGKTSGKRMSKADWRAEAEQQLRNGNADPEVQKAFDEASDPEIQSASNKS
jgi:hypothetical protein